ncbi:MAG: phosphoribosylanthranilate isomerase [Gammaproteobacteria bacterium]|nr:phosphoribosylanthranilate isomerase [Gammaproteobacteria bacterium]
MRTRVKICGITRNEDALAAAALGADAIGLVFYARSPRRVDVARAAEIAAGLPPFVQAVGLFVDAGAAEIAAVLERVRVDLLQFHGDESPADCRGFGLPYIKAVRMRPGIDVRAEAERYHDARALLLDTYRPGVAGGTGATFSWDEIPPRPGAHLLLAGGLTPENVNDAIRAVRPYGVDVSGGVEAAKGVKDAARMAAFFAAVRRADADGGGRDTDHFS